jgi:hypothetical protein
MPNTLLVPLAQLRLNDENPRLVKEARFTQLVKSLQDFPQMLDLRPCVVDESYRVLGGNMRLRALQHLGYREVPVVVADGLTQEQKREFILKDNASFGEWDWDALANGDWPDATQLNAWGIDVPADWVIEPEVLEDISLPDGEKAPFKQMVFMLTDRQAQEVEAALALSKQENDFEGTGNDNSNGNALAFIVAEYLSARNGD